MNDVDKGWICGIIDGEGCLYIHRRQRNTVLYMPSLLIVNTDKNIIDKCYNILKVGKVFVRKRKIGRPQWCLSLMPTALREILPKIKDELVKKDQAELLLRALYINKYRGATVFAKGPEPRPQYITDELEQIWLKLKKIHRPLTEL